MAPSPPPRSRLTIALLLALAAPLSPPSRGAAQEPVCTAPSEPARQAPPPRAAGASSSSAAVPEPSGGESDGSGGHTLPSALLFPFGIMVAILGAAVAYLHTLNRRLEGANRELAGNEQRLRLVFDISLAGIVTLDPAGYIVMANERMAELFALPLGELIGTFYPDLLHPKHREAAGTSLQKLLSGRGDRIFEERHYHRRDGGDFWGLLSGRCHRAADGSLLAVVCLVTDITWQKKAELELQESVAAQRDALREIQARKAKLAIILESSQAGIITHDSEGTITYANRRIASLFGRDSADLIGTHFPDHVHPDEREESRANLRRLFAGATPRVGVERRYVKGDGTVFWVYLTASPLDNGTDRPDSILCVITDISDLKKAQDDLHENRRFLADLIEYSGTIIAVKDREGRYQMVNRKWEETTGLARTEALGKTDGELFPGATGREFRRHDLEVIEKGRSIEREETLGDPPRYFLSSKFPVKGKDDAVRGVCLMSTEITERKRGEEERLKLEQQLLHTQKLESLGVLAGGIAHDFNNILLAVLGNADLALLRLPKESPAVENLRRIEKAAAQAAELAKQMLAYSGKGKFVIEQLDLNRLLEEMLHMLEVSISKKAVLRLRLARPLHSVEGDASQLRQVIMNMVINASEAIGEKSGVIAITTGCLDCDEKYLRDVWLDEKLPPGRYAFVEVADTGCGMSRDTVGKIFDPFFTTKFTGRGLGMAAVLGIVRGHRGAIKVYSEPGRGSTFKVLFPASGNPAELFDHDPVHDQWRGSGTVLLVDDEETVRTIGRQMLEELGFSVVTANDGRHALEVYRAHEEVSFVLLDLTMPHLDGEQCFRELRRIDGSVKVIMSSGYNEHEVTQKFLGKGLAGFIQKPYKLSTLRETIAGALTAESGTVPQ